MNDSIMLTVSPIYIQSLRLIHAVAETGIDLRVHPTEFHKFNWLLQFFDFTLRPEERTPSRRVHATVDHITPITAIGGLSRPLIFPRGVVDRSRKMWDDNRPLNFSFTGNITSARRNRFKEWIDQWGVVPDILQQSNQGREWPKKGWDEEYIKVLGSTRFALCPNGTDFKIPWTYRVFEAALCGAIPIVESLQDRYKGFSVALMTDDPTELCYSQEAVEHNYFLAVKRLTVPLDELVSVLKI